MYRKLDAPDKSDRSDRSDWSDNVAEWNAWIIRGRTQRWRLRHSDSRRSGMRNPHPRRFSRDRRGGKEYE